MELVARLMRAAPRGQTRRCAGFFGSNGGSLLWSGGRQAAWSLFGRHGFNHRVAAAGLCQRRPGLRDGGVNQRFHGWLSQRLRAFESHETILVSTPEQDLAGIWQ